MAEACGWNMGVGHVAVTQREDTWLGHMTGWDTGLGHGQDTAGHNKGRDKVSHTRTRTPPTDLFTSSLLCSKHRDVKVVREVRERALDS
jgi:hypothetical protein